MSARARDGERAPSDPAEVEARPSAVSVERLFDETAGALLARQKTPLSTYRMQVHKGFPLKDAHALLEYLEALGISHIYSSPLLKAFPGSNHGYDVIDHTQLNPEVGTEAEFDAFTDELQRRGIGLVLDVVPNHMGIERHNKLWLDVLENGQASPFAKFFDIDWNPVKEELKNKVLLPILGDQYGVVLENGELKLEFKDGAFIVRYWESCFPIAPRQYAKILSLGLDELVKRLGSMDEHVIELQSILTAISHLPTRLDVDPAKVVERAREKEVIKRRLANLYRASEVVRQFVDRNVAEFNGRKGDVRSFDRLDDLLTNCSYRLAFWRVAGEEINYRRFFDINSLAAVRVEDRDVFEEVHKLPLEWIKEGRIHGLRIDHPDGLFDPTAYFLNLQESYFLQEARKQFDRRPEGEWAQSMIALRELYRARFTEDPTHPLFRSLYLIVEKIQGGRERIPEAWAVHGTTGYRFANLTTGLFVQREHEQELTETYARFIGRLYDFHHLVYEKKKLILSVSMASEVNVLARELNRISELDRRSRDFTMNLLKRALVEFIALFPVYRTYVDGWRAEVDQRDVQYIEWTIARAKEHDPTTNASIYDFLKDVLLRRYPEHLPEKNREQMLRFAMKVQQLTGPVMAKGLEDTVFYIYNRLTSLNEVGGEPERFGSSVEQFHLRNQERAEKWPAALLASTTHDTKRSEDVRARLNVISEVPEDWKKATRAWARTNKKYKTRVGERLCPDSNDEYLFYQALLGAWPMGEHLSDDEFETFRARLRDYLAKAIKEAKVHTSWTNPDPAYDEAMAKFIDQSLTRNAPFKHGAFTFKQLIEHPGQLNALGQLLLKLASPGVPDFYQGNELWDLSLVDPDNRRPVDYTLRQRLLSELDGKASKDRLQLADELSTHMADGRIKLYVTAMGLRLRRSNEELFRRGDYLALDVQGEKARHLIAFARRHEDEAIVTVVPRFTVPLLAHGGLSASLRGTHLVLPESFGSAPLRNVFTGEELAPERKEAGLTIDAGALLEHFPVALLSRRNSKV
ncbi:MAG: malto-oligosyltrehalose synthase [Myxococcaceae bacterium]